MNRDGIIRVLGELGAQNVLGYGENVQCSCVLAKWSHKGGTDRKPSMGVSIDEHGESFVNCFGCRFGGTLETLVTKYQMYSGEDMTKVLRIVADAEEIDTEWLAEHLPSYEDPSDKYEHTFIPESEIEHMMGQAPRYILDRGFDIETLKAWKVGYDEARQRVVVPVRASGGQLVGLVGRTIIGECKPKYLNYFKFDRGRYLFGAHMVRPKTALVVTEGLFDALAVWQALRKADALGSYSVVASLGANTTRHQRRQMFQLSDEIVLFFDNDAAGWEGQTETAKAIQRQALLKAVRYPDPVGGDPASLVQSGVDVASLISNADLYVV